MENTMKRLLSFAVALIMVLSLVPVTEIEVKAATETDTAAESSIVTANTAVWSNATGDWKIVPSTKRVDLSKINAPLEGTENADGTLSARCEFCGKTRNWKPITNNNESMPILWEASDNDTHYYLKEDVTTTAVNTPEGTGSYNNQYFWLWIANRNTCLHLNGHDLTMENENYKGYIYLGSNMLNIMGEGTVTGNCPDDGAADHSTGIRGAAVNINCSTATYGILNLFGGTYKSGISGRPAVGTSGKGGQIDIYPDATVEGIAQAGGEVNLFGGTIDGAVTVRKAINAEDPVFNLASGKITGSIQMDAGVFNMTGGLIDNPVHQAVYITNKLLDGAYTSSQFNMSGGMINGQLQTNRPKTVNLKTDTDTSNSWVAAADNVAPIGITVSGGTVNGIGTKETPYSTSGSCFFITEGAKLTIADKAVINAGYLTVDTDGNYGWGGAIYAKYPSGVQDTSVLQTVVEMTGGTVNCAGDADKVGARVGGFAYLFGYKKAAENAREYHPGKGVKLIMSGGIVNGGRVSATGGAIHSASCEIDITGGTITGGRAGTWGGNIFVDNSQTSPTRLTLNIQNALIENGVASGARTSSTDYGYFGGGNLCLGLRIDVNVTNATISGGTAVGGGNIGTRASTIINLNEGAVLTGGTATGYSTYYYGGNWQASTGTININAGARVDNGTCNLDNKGSNLSAIWGSKINVNGGVIGNADETGEQTVRLYSNNSNSESQLNVTDGIVYGNTALDSTVKVGMYFTHGVFSADPTAAAGTQSVVRNSEGLYEVHNASYATNVTQSSCTADGYTAITCDYATCTGYKTDITAKHTQTPVAEASATCLKDGHKAYYTCSCGKVYADAACETEIADLDAWKAGDGKLEKLEHSYTGENDICVNGCEKPVCDNEGHSWGEEISAQAANCSNTGYKAHYQCAVCGLYSVLSEGNHVIVQWESLVTETAPNVHGYNENNVCIFCNKSYCDNMGGHDWGNEIAASDATCSAKGNVAHYICSYCGSYAVGEEKTIKTQAEIEIAIDEDAHSYGAWTKVDEQTHQRVCTYDATHIETGDHDFANGDCICGAEGPKAIPATDGMVTANGDTHGVISRTDSEVTITVTEDVLWQQGYGTEMFGNWVGFQLTAPEGTELSQVIITRPDGQTRVMDAIKDGADFVHMYWGFQGKASEIATYTVDWNNDEIVDLTVKIDASAVKLQQAPHTEAVTANGDTHGQITAQGNVVTVKAAGTIDFQQGTGTELWDNWVGFVLTAPEGIEAENVTVIRPDKAERNLAAIADDAAKTYCNFYWGVSNSPVSTYEVDWNSDGLTDLYINIDATEAELVAREAVYNGVAYAELEAALNAAAENGGTVKLVDDASADSVTVLSGVTLDLNGKTLTATGYVLAAFADSYIVDGSSKNAGRLAMDVEKLRLLNNNSALPVQMSDGIMFVDVALDDNWSQTSDRYQFWFDSADQALIDALTANGAAASKLAIQVEMSWDGGQSNMVYTYKEDIVSQYLSYWNTGSLNLTVNGAEGIDDFTYVAKIVFAEDTLAEVAVEVDLPFPQQ